MTLPTSHREIVELLGVQKLAALPNCSYGRVRQWRDRDRIAGDWVVRVSIFARDNGHPEITPEFLDRIAPKREGAGGPRAHARTHEGSTA